MCIILCTIYNNVSVERTGRTGYISLKHTHTHIYIYINADTHTNTHTVLVAGRRNDKHDSFSVLREELINCEVYSVWDINPGQETGRFIQTVINHRGTEYISLTSRIAIYACVYIGCPG